MKLTGLISDEFYLISSENNALAYWIPSPAAKWEGSIMMGGRTQLSSRGWGDIHVGFRPLVCLKSNVQLRKVEDGYKIIE